MATYQKFNSLVEALSEKAHDLGSDQLKIALCAAANAPVAGNAVLADLTPITPVLTGATPLNLTTTSSAQTSGTYKLVLADLTITADTGGNPTFRYVVIYNDTATSKELIGFFDYGSDVTLAEGDQYVIDFNPTTGAIQIV